MKIYQQIVNHISTGYILIKEVGDYSQISQPIMVTDMIVEMVDVNI